MPIDIGSAIAVRGSIVPDFSGTVSLSIETVIWSVADPPKAGSGIYNAYQACVETSQTTSTSYSSAANWGDNHSLAGTILDKRTFWGDHSLFTDLLDLLGNSHQTYKRTSVMSVIGVLPSKQQIRNILEIQYAPRPVTGTSLAAGPSTDGMIFNVNKCLSTWSIAALDNFGKLLV